MIERTPHVYKQTKTYQDDATIDVNVNKLKDRIELWHILHIIDGLIHVCVMMGALDWVVKRFPCRTRMIVGDARETTR